MNDGDTVEINNEDPLPRIMDIIPNLPKYKEISLDNIDELDRIFKIMKESIKEALEREYTLWISQDQNKLVLDVWLF